MAQANQRFVDEPLSISAGGAIDDFDESVLQKKESFCFCCCDYRRAVIVIDILQSISVFMSFFKVDGVVAYMVDSGYPDESVDRAIVVFLDLVLFALTLSGIYGAVKYVRNGVMAGLVAHSLNFLYLCFSLVATLFSGEKIKNAVQESIDQNGMAGIDDDATVQATIDAMPSIIIGVVVFGDVILMILNGFYIHAHVKLLRLMKEGVMTPQNYPHVSKCCC